MTEPATPRPSLAEANSIADLTAFLRTERALVAERVRARHGGLAVASAWSDTVDAVVRRMLAIACERAGRIEMETIPVAIVATGGYGRRELCPCSDIDITFIPHRDGDPTVDRLIKEMFTLVMGVFIDGNRMDVGYAYRLIEDCGVLDHQTACGLLDARLIGGSDRLFIRFEGEYWNHFNAAEFIYAKLDERRKQHRDAGNTPRIVEPNLKTSPGGLRDLQCAAWVTQAREHLDAASVRGGRVFGVLARCGGLSEAEAEEMAAAKEFLFRLRNALHVITGEERDQVVVTRQEELAEILGYADQEAGCSTPPVEPMMRDYYAGAACVHRICTDVMRHVEHSRLFIGIGLDCVDRRITPANPVLASDDPIWMLWACEMAQRHGLELSDDLCREAVALVRARPVILDQERAAQILTNLIVSPRGAYPMLQRMADLGILAWALPEVGRIMDLIPYDPSHEYTVGQHTLYVIRVLDNLRLLPPDDDTRDFRVLLTELPDPEQLYLAALLHDAGKTDDSRPHSETGAEIAREVCQRLRWSEDATENVCFLVRTHLMMAETSRLRDLNLDETIRDFVSIVDTYERLVMLYLLTYADTRAVGAGVWTQVKGRFLRDLFRRAERAIMSEPIEEDGAAVALLRTRKRLMRELAVENLPPDDVAAHLEGMPAPYVLNTSLDEMALHIGFARRAREGAPVVEFHDERGSTFTEITICTLDDPAPGLLAKVAGVLLAADLEVHAAQVFTRVAGEERIAIDTLFVDFRGRQLTTGKRREVSRWLTDVLTGVDSVQELLRRKRKPAETGGRVEHLAVRNDLSEHLTVTEATCADSQTALYRVSGALSALGWDIHSARVSLFGGRTVASFYVSGARALGDEAALSALRRLLPTP